MTFRNYKYNFFDYWFQFMLRPYPRQGRNTLLEAFASNIDCYIWYNNTVHIIHFEFEEIVLSVWFMQISLFSAEYCSTY